MATTATPLPAPTLVDAPNGGDPWKRDWRKAGTALRRLLNDANDTTQVFEIMRSLNRPSTRKGYMRLIDGPTGARLAYERTELAGRLMDPDWLARFADGTVGAAYRDFTMRENLTAEGLATVSQQGLRADLIDQPDPVAWYGRRIRDVHDIWHVLTGYGPDPLGEACLVAFSYAQTRGLGWLAIALGAAWKGGGEPGVRPAIREGFRRGHRAVWLPGVDYEMLLATPLETARRDLRIGTPRVYREVLPGLRESQMFASLSAGKMSPGR